MRKLLSKKILVLSLIFLGVIRNIVQTSFHYTLFKRFCVCYQWGFFNDTHREKLCFAQFSRRIYWNRSLAASGLAPMSTQTIQFYKFDCYIWNSTDVLKRWLIHQTERKQTVALFSNYYGRIWLVFVLTQENAFSWRLPFKVNRKNISSSKKR